jgi:hypothetical protein
MKKVIYSLVFFSASVFAQNSEYQITEKLKAGEYLIYDCQQGFYTCVDFDSYTNCQTRRKHSADKKEKSLACAPLKKFNKKEECLQANYSVIEGGKKKRFCFPE